MALLFYEHAANVHAGVFYCTEHETGNTKRVQMVIYLHLTAAVRVSLSEAAVLSVSTVENVDDGVHITHVGSSLLACSGGAPRNGSTQLLTS